MENYEKSQNRIYFNQIRFVSTDLNHLNIWRNFATCSFPVIPSNFTVNWFKSEIFLQEHDMENYEKSQNGIYFNRIRYLSTDLNHLNIWRNLITCSFPVIPSNFTVNWFKSEYFLQEHDMENYDKSSNRV